MSPREMRERASYLYAEISGLCGEILRLDDDGRHREADVLDARRLVLQCELDHLRQRLDELGEASP